MTSRTLLMMFALLPLLAGAGTGVAVAGATPSLFGTKEIRNGNLKPFPKWTGMLERYFRETGTKPGSCASRVYNVCHAQKWQALIDQQQGLALTAQLEAVNSFMNKTRYIIDPINWRVADYWETPGQFFTRDGDCEDYAIVKYMTLKRLGVDPSTMRIVVLQDMNLRIAHAVLAVYVNDDIIILDNQINRTVNAKVIRHYKPIFSINEEAWWLHRANRTKRRGKRRVRRG